MSFSDSLAYLMTFLAIKTTSRVATYVANHDGRGARLAAREGLWLSAIVGSLMALSGELGGAAGTLRSVYVTGRTAAVLAPATTYCRIRGAAMPLQLMWQTAQAASIARRISKVMNTSKKVHLEPPGVGDDTIQRRQVFFSARDRTIEELRYYRSVAFLSA